jgi:HEAT repeat protein
VSGEQKHVRALASAARDRGDIGTLLAFLTGTDAAARDTAVYNLGKLGDPAAAKPVARLLNSRDDGVRILVLRALRRIGDESVVPEVYETAASDESFLVRITAMETLGSLGDRRAVRLLGSALHDDQMRDPRWFRKWAAKRLIELRGKEAIPDLARARQSAGLIGRWRLSRAIRTLERI